MKPSCALSSRVPRFSETYDRAGLCFSVSRQGIVANLEPYDLCLRPTFPAAYQLFDLGQVILYLKVNFSSIKWDLYLPDARCL